MHDEKAESVRYEWSRMDYLLEATHHIQMSLKCLEQFQSGYDSAHAAASAGKLTEAWQCLKDEALAYDPPEKA